MPYDLGNKANPFLAGITGLGQGLFQGFLTRRKMDEEQRQFNERMAMQERQNSLLMDLRQKEYELNVRQEDRLSGNVNQDSTIVQQGDMYNKIGIEPGKYPNSLLDNWMQRMEPPTKENDFTLGEGQTRFNAEGEPIASIPDKPEKTSDFTKFQNWSIGEKQKEKVLTLDEETGNMLTILQSGGVDKNNVEYKGNTFKKSVLAGQFANKVNTLINTLEIKPTVNSLILKAHTDYPDFKKKSKTEQRNILKKYLDDNQEIPDTIKSTLYKYAETYRD